MKEEVKSQFKIAPPSEGEIFLKEYFDEENIQYTSQPKIEGLQGDSKAFRIADFQLTKYKVYVEFNGRWLHGEEDRERYRHKESIYKHNKIPCIYFYPENLGAIDFFFDKRLTKVLKKYGLRKELRLWRFKKVWQEESGSLIGFILFVFLGSLCFTPPESIKVGVILFSISLFILVKSIFNILKIIK